MAKEILAIAFSDLHMNNWKKFNENGARNESHFSVLKLVCRKAIELQVPILFCGDWIHTNETVDMDLLIQSAEVYCEMNAWDWGVTKIYAISGNHDLPGPNSYESPRDSYINYLSKLYDWICCIDQLNPVLPNGLSLYGVPYLDNNVGLRRSIKSFKVSKKHKNILMLHTDYAGARDTDDRVIDSVENLNRAWMKKFDLVLCGHIHLHQKLDNNVLMLGAPLQQRFTDEGTAMGYTEVYTDMTYKFKPISGMPEFITVTTKEEEKGDGNYYRVIDKSKVKAKSNNHVGVIIHKDFSKVKVVNRYLRAKGVKDKEKKKVLINVIKKTDD